MGAQVSTAVDTSTQITNAVASAVVSNNSSCGSSTTQGQNISFGKIKGDFNASGINMEQNASVNLSCLQTSVDSTSLASNIMEKLSQQAKTSNSGQNIGAQVSTSVAATKLVNNIAESVNLSNVKACLAATNQSQVVGAEYVGGNVNLSDIKMSQAVNLVASCIQSDKNTSNLINKLATTIQQESAAENKGFLNMGNIGLIIAAIIGVIVLLAIIKEMSGGGAGNAGKGGGGGGGGKTSQLNARLQSIQQTLAGLKAKGTGAGGK